MFDKMLYANAKCNQPRVSPPPNVIDPNTIAPHRQIPPTPPKTNGLIRNVDEGGRANGLFATEIPFPAVNLAPSPLFFAC